MMADSSEEEPEVFWDAPAAEWAPAQQNLMRQIEAAFDYMYELVMFDDDQLKAHKEEVSKLLARWEELNSDQMARMGREELRAFFRRKAMYKERVRSQLRTLEEIGMAPSTSSGRGEVAPLRPAIGTHIPQLQCPSFSGEGGVGVTACRDFLRKFEFCVGRYASPAD